MPGPKIIALPLCLGIPKSSAFDAFLSPYSYRCTLSTVKRKVPARNRPLGKRKPGQADDGWAALHGLLRDARSADVSEPSLAGDRNALAKLHKELGKRGSTQQPYSSPLEADLGPDRGRPRHDDKYREIARKMREKRAPWKDIAAALEKETNSPWTVDACRALLRTRPPRRDHPDS